jgi:hypothetical protein
MYRNGTDVNNFRTAIVIEVHICWANRVSDGRGGWTSVVSSSGYRPLVVKNNTNKTLNMTPGVSLHFTDNRKTAENDTEENDIVVWTKEYK